IADYSATHSRNPFSPRCFGTSVIIMDHCARDAAAVEFVVVVFGVESRWSAPWDRVSPMPVYEYRCKQCADNFDCGLRRAGLTKLIVLVAVAGAMAIPSAGQSEPSASTKSGAPAAAARNWTLPKTAWGDPDLQGMWPNTDLLGVPLQRDPKLGTRALLTDAEYAQREARAKRSDEGLNQKYDKLDGPVSTGSPIWWIEHGRPTRQASLIVAPPDGRIPPLTAEAIKLAEARDAKFHLTYGVERKATGSNETW